jgi:lysozyme
MGKAKRPLAAIVGTVAAALITVALPQLEGNKLKSYRDVVGVWTNCAGNTHNVQPGVTLTKEQCDEINSDNAAAYAEAADKCVPMESLKPQVRVAVVLFTINEGPGAFCSSVFAARLKAKDPQACDELGLVKDPRGLPKWTTAGGQYWPGLQNRRDAERRICYMKDL